MKAYLKIAFVSLATVLATLGSFTAARADPITIQFGPQPIMNLSPNPLFPNEFDFAAQANPANSWWSTSAGTVILNLVPGPGATNLSAALILTGTRGPDGVRGTADDVPFRIFYNPTAAPVNRTVLIQFSSGLFNPIVAPVDDLASLNGSFQNVGPDGVFGTADDTGVGLLGDGRNGILLRANSDAGEFCNTAPRFTQGDAPPAGAFARACGPVRDPRPPVMSLQGFISFSFGAGNLNGDSVILPNSAVVQAASAVPEPTTMLLLGTGLAGVAIKTRKRLKKQQRKQR